MKSSGLVWPLFYTRRLFYLVFVGVLTLLFGCARAQARAISGKGATDMAILEVQHIEKHFGATQVLQDISFALEQGQALAIIGSSGSGKTTLLRCLNFLETPDRGSIAVDGERLFDAADPATQRESEIRKKRLHFGLVFQSFNLFPQYTALQNVTLAQELLAKERPDYKQSKQHPGGDRSRGPGAAGRRWAWRTGRTTIPTSSPAASSSGWPSPGPWPCTRTSSALTSPPPPWTRSSPARCCKVIRSLAEQNTTMIIVTHEMAFARDVADQVIFMDGGVIVEQGPAREVIEHPREERTRQFLARYADNEA